MRSYIYKQVVLFKNTSVINMRFIKQSQVIKVQNFDSDVKIKKKHGALFPNSIRGIIVGPSNCGKTNVMLSILLDPYGFKFENIYIY